jgi:hypothetical protein
VTHLFFLLAISVRECNLKLAAVTQPAIGMQAVGGLDYELYPFYKKTEIVPTYF